MPRMKTEKANYARVELRLPPDLLEAYRGFANREGRAMNTQLVRSLQEWLDQHRIAKDPIHHDDTPTPASAPGSRPGQALAGVP